MTHAAAPLTPGTRLARRYLLIRPLGAGAMGTVFEAADERTSSRCAIKVIHPHIAEAETSAERFHREATLTQRVRHPAIVKVLDGGLDFDFGLFLVMELLEGMSLRRRLGQHEMTVTDGLHVVAAMLDGLHAAHRVGIVHRDLKPDNIFLHAPAGGPSQVKLLDFGVARELEHGGLTTTNIGLGTPRFMAPEQAADARSVTPASDVWSVGVLIYQIVSGSLPFDGDGPYETMLKACTAAHAPLSYVAPDVDPGLATIVQTCLEKRPEARFPDAGALLAALRPILEDDEARARMARQIAAAPTTPSRTQSGDPVIAPPSGPASERPWSPRESRRGGPKRIPLILAAALATGATVGGFWAARTLPEEPTVVPLPIQVADEPVNPSKDSAAGRTEAAESGPPETAGPRSPAPRPDLPEPSTSRRERLAKDILRKWSQRKAAEVANADEEATAPGGDRQTDPMKDASDDTTSDHSPPLPGRTSEVHAGAAEPAERAQPSEPTKHERSSAESNTHARATPDVPPPEPSEAPKARLQEPGKKPDAAAHKRADEDKEPDFVTF